MSRLIRKIIEWIVRKKTFYQIFFFNIMVSSFILLVATLILYASFRSAGIKEIENKSFDQLKQTMAVYNSLHNILITSIIPFFEEQLISELLYKKDTSPYRISLALDRLDAFQTSFFLLQSIYVYNRQRNEYYSTIQGVEGQHPSDLNLPEIISNIKNYNTYRYIPRKMHMNINNRVNRYPIGDVRENVITFIAGDMPYSSVIKKSFLIINISEEKLRNAYLAAKSPLGGELIIVDGEGKALSHPDNNLFGENLSATSYIKKVFSMKEQQGNFITGINGVRYLLTYVRLPSMEWTFINITPYNQIFKNVDSLRNLSIVLFFLLIIIAAVLSLQISRQIYRPMQKLFQSALYLGRKLEDNSGGVAAEKSGEFEYIDEVFSRLADKVDKLDNYMETHKQSQTNELLRDIILGNILPSEIVNEYENPYKNFFDSGIFYIAVIKIDRFQLIFNYLDRDFTKKWHGMISENLSKNIRYGNIIAIMERDRLAVVCRIEFPDNNILQNLKTDILSAQKLLKEQMEITFSAGISKIIEHENDIAPFYRDTSKLVLYSFRNGPGTVIDYDEVYPKTGKEYVYPEKKSKLLFNELKLGKLDKVEVFQNEIMNEIKEYSFDDFRFMIQFLAYQTLKVITKMESDTHFELGECRKLLANIINIETIFDAHDIFFKVFYEIVKVLSSGKQNSRTELIGSVKKYIREHLSDSGLCPDKIAQTIGFTAQHIRNLFKETEEISLSGYIHDLRIERCKKLLVETGLSVKEVSNQSGFINYTYFFTAFKKHTGLTPELYRRKNSTI